MTLDELREKYEAARAEERRLYSRYMASGMNTHKEAWEVWQGQKAHADRLQRAIDRFEGRASGWHGRYDRLDEGIGKAIDIFGRNASVCERRGLLEAASAYRHAARVIRRVRSGRVPEDLCDDLRTSAEVFRVH